MSTYRGEAGQRGEPDGREQDRISHHRRARSDEFDTAITDFPHRHAGQNERDYQAFLTTVRSGHLEALDGV